MQGRVQIGAPWWWNDHFRGIYDWLDAAMYYSVLSGFFGFTTDSRCILSLSRHDYFRRVLCSFLSDKVRSGELNGKFDVLAEIIYMPFVTTTPRDFSVCHANPASRSDIAAVFADIRSRFRV